MGGSGSKDEAVEQAKEDVREALLRTSLEPLWKILMTKLDANGNGKVTKEELTAFVAEISSTAPQKRPSMVGSSSAIHVP